VAVSSIAAAQLGLAVGIAQIATGHAGLRELALLLPLYLLTTLGVTLGYHRLLAHRSFKAGKSLTRLVAALGAMAGMGPPVMWVSNHRRHHAKSDQDGDPHSPRRGFWHAHVLWLFREAPASPLQYSRDLLQNDAVAWVTRRYRPLLLAGILAPGLLGLALGLHPAQGVLWGGLVRLALNQHAIWSSGSLAHLFGRRPFKTGDDSRNNAFVAALALGEGWHNNHHAFPDVAVHGFRKREVDVTGLAIAALERAGLITEVKRRAN
jgi:stearoyl-CoA desaturase (delta-9 desaturase)